MSTSDETKCQYCCKNLYKVFNRKRHELQCSSRTEPVVAPTCVLCSRMFLTEKSLNLHVLKCSTAPCKEPKKRKQCFVGDCTLEFFHRTTLIGHIKACHTEITIKDPVYLKFKSLEEFLDWKEKEEEATFSYYYQKRGHNKCHIQYFDCQHDASDKLHSARKTSRRRSIPSIKRGHCCISKMKVWNDEDGLINLEYWPTHSHRVSPEEFHTQPASKKTLKYIDQHISLGVSPSKIYSNLQESVQTKTDSVRFVKSNVITVNRIRKRARKIKNSKMFHMDDAESVSLMAETMSQEDDSECRPTFEEIIECRQSNQVPKALSDLEKDIDHLQCFITAAREGKVSDEIIFQSAGIIHDLVLRQQYFLKTKETKLSAPKPMQ